MCCNNYVKYSFRFDKLSGPVILAINLSEKLNKFILFYNQYMTIPTVRIVLQIIILGVFLNSGCGQSEQWCLSRQLRPGTKPITSSDFSPDGNIFATASQDRNVQLWDTSSWTLLNSYSSSVGTPLTVRFSKDNTKLAIGYNSSFVQVISIPQMQVIFSNSTGLQQVNQVDWSEGSDKLLACGFNRSFLVWNTAGYTVQISKYVNDRVLSCKFDSNGRVVIGRNEGSGQVFGSAIVYEPTSFTEIMQVNKSLDMNCVDVKPGGQYLIAANQIGQAYLIQVATNTSTDLLTGKQMLSCAYSRQSNYFAFGNNISQLFIFDAATNAQIAMKTNTPGELLHLVFTYDGSFLASTDTAGYIFIYEQICCSSGFYKDSVSCLQCSDAISNCLTCSSQSDCLTCANGYQFDSNSSMCIQITCFPECQVCLDSVSCSTCVIGNYLDSSNTCQLCSSALPNCQQCSSSIICTSCSFGFYLSSGVCLPCNSIPNCVDCSSSSICVDCDPGYYVNSTFQCQFVPCNVNNCDICQASDPNICSSCSNGYQLTESNQCLIIPCTSPCSKCSTALISSPCISCVTGFYLNIIPPNQGNCLTCNSSILHCTECFDQNNCASCLIGTYLSVGLCLQCTTSITNCAQCSSSLVCDICNSRYFLTLDGTSCISCQTHHQNCTQCTPSQCTSCDPGYSLVANDSTKCQIISCSIQNCQQCLQSNAGFCSICFLGYWIDASGRCNNRCGDGVYVASNQQCDDGNLYNMDGCSESCKKQDGFQCDVPTPPAIPLSDCTYFNPINLSINFVQKVPGFNKVKSQMLISPLLKAFQTFNFSTLVSTNLPVSSHSFEYDKASGLLRMILSYQDSIQGLQAIVTISPPQQRMFRLTPPSSTRIMMSSRDNTGLYVYSEETYALANGVSAITTAISVIAWVLLILSLFAGKLIAIQLFAVLQISFLGLMMVSKMNPTLSALKSLFLSNGFNKLLADPFNSQTVPQQMKGLGLNQSFLNDFNVGLALIFIPLIIALVAWILSKTVFKPNQDDNAKQLDKDREEKNLLMQQIYVRAAGEYTLMMLVLNCYIVSVSMALQFLYGFNQLQGVVGYISIPQCILMIAILTTYLVLLFVKPNIFGDFKIYFDPNSKFSYYTYNYFILQRVFIGFLLTALYFTPYALLLPIIIFLGQTIFFAIKKPYNKIRHSYRMVTNNIISIIVLAIYMYYSFDPQTSSTSQAGIYLPLIIILLLAVSLLVNAVFIIHLFVKWIKSHCCQSEQQKKTEIQMQNMKMGHAELHQFAPSPMNHFRNQNDKSMIPKVQKLGNKTDDDQLKQFSLQLEFGQGYPNIYDSDFQQKLEQQNNKVKNTALGLNQMKKKLNLNHMIASEYHNSNRDALIEQEI